MRNKLGWPGNLWRALKGGPKENPDWPVWYREYYRGQPGPLEKDHRPLAEVPIVVLDTETTGLDTKRDQILCIGGLRVLGNGIQLGDKFEAYLPTPPGFENARAVAIHGIIPNSNRYHYVDEPTLLADLMTYLDGAIIVGHHIGFDVEMIDQALQRRGAGRIVNRVVDTARLAQRLHPKGYWSPKEDYSLDALARRYRIPLSDRHTALGDCYISAVLWLKLLTRLATKLGRDLKTSDVSP